MLDSLCFSNSPCLVGELLCTFCTSHIFRCTNTSTHSTYLMQPFLCRPFKMWRIFTAFFPLKIWSTFSISEGHQLSICIDSNWSAVFLLRSTLHVQTVRISGHFRRPKVEKKNKKPSISHCSCIFVSRHFKPSPLYALYGSKHYCIVQIFPQTRSQRSTRTWYFLIYYINTNIISFVAQMIVPSPGNHRRGPPPLCPVHVQSGDISLPSYTSYLGNLMFCNITSSHF